MSFLLDTNALIFTLFVPGRISETTLPIIENAEGLYVSIMSLWEIGIKQSIGKIDIDASMEEIANTCRSINVSIVPLKPAHIERMKLLPQIHKDPFDRIIIAQALEEGMTLITSDEIIPQYPDVDVIW